MGKYNIGEVWWTHFPYSDMDVEKRRPAIVIDDDTIAILAMYVTSQKKENNPYSIEIEDWKEAGLPKESWTRIDRIVQVSERHMDRKIGDLSQGDLKKIMQLVAEIMMGSFHDFSLIAIQNSSDKYLQLFDERWQCWLFPYIRSTDENKVNVDGYVSNLIKRDVETEYVTNAKHCKYSVSDKVYKIYNHKLYKLSLDTVPEYMEDDSFVIDGKNYKWMSIEEMENDKTIMEKNEDIVAFVKTKCS